MMPEDLSRQVTLPTAFLEQEQALYTKKLNHLRLQRIPETDASVQFKLNIEIEALEQRLREIAEQLRQASTASTIDQVYQALLDLDYKEQIKRFRRILARQTIFACLIYGEAYHGQRWLLNQLIDMIPGSIAAKKVFVNLGRRGRSTSISALWRELGQQVGLSGLQSAELIAQKVQQWLQTQSVVLVLDQVDMLSVEQIAALQTRFWQLVVTAVSDGGAPPQHKLLLILVDYSGATEHWPWESVELPGSNWHPRLMVRLPVVTRFTLDLLIHWLDDQVRFPPDGPLEKPEATARELIAASEEGIPEYVFDAICTLCKLRWNDYEGIWMKY